MPQLLATCERVVRDSPRCEVMLGTQTRRLLFDDGRVSGAEVVSASGGHRAIDARFTLLATGGFGGDSELRERHIHRLARDLPLRANPHSTGDGLRLGLSAGAAFGKDGAGRRSPQHARGARSTGGARAVRLRPARARRVDCCDRTLPAWSRLMRSSSRTGAALAAPWRMISMSWTTCPRNGGIPGRSCAEASRSSTRLAGTGGSSRRASPIRPARSTQIAGVSHSNRLS